MSDWFSQGRKVGTVRLDEVLDEPTLEAFRDVIACGGMVTAGLTRDGGALGLTVFCNGRKRSEYVTTAVAAREYLAGAYEALSGQPSGGRPAIPVVPIGDGARKARRGPSGAS